eukprot:scaffold22813_cov78-Cyclotella_meneghiniana.AAC.16
MTKQNNRTTSAPLPTIPGPHSMETTRSRRSLPEILLCNQRRQRCCELHGLTRHSGQQLTFNDFSCVKFKMAEFSVLVWGAIEDCNCLHD